MKHLLRAGVVAVAIVSSGLAHGAETEGSAALRQIMGDLLVWYQKEFPILGGEQKETEYRLPDLSTASMDRRLKALEAFARRLEAVPEADISNTDHANREILLRSIRNYLTRFSYGTRMIHFSRHGAWHNVADAAKAQPFLTKTHFERYISFLNNFPKFNKQGIATSREALRQGFVQTCDAIQGLEKSIQVHLVEDVSRSAYMEPFKRRPSGIGEAEWAALKSRAEAAVRDQLIPALRELEAFYLTEYAPNCRKSVSIAALPGGADYYTALARAVTSIDLSPEEIHQVGLGEVARIRAEMDAAVKRSGFKGDRAAFIEMLRTDPRFYAKSPDELLMRTRALAKQIDGELPKLFGRLPRLPYTVKPIPDSEAAMITTAYFMSGDMKAGRAGLYALNISRLDQRPLYELPALTLHEAVPGHHLQTALQQELDLPDIRRRFVNFVAFDEGWGLYAESLGYEMGLYDDPYAEFGRLSNEMWRACRLVVDTGIHVKGWTRSQAINFMLENTALSRHNIEIEVDRYTSSPAQALAYKIGELKIRELRSRAEEALGDRFDIRMFHDAVLENGSVPLDVLENHIDGWIARQLQQQAAQPVTPAL